MTEMVVMLVTVIASIKLEEVGLSRILEEYHNPECEIKWAVPCLYLASAVAIFEIGAYAASSLFPARQAYLFLKSNFIALSGHSIMALALGAYYKALYFEDDDDST